MIGKGLVEMSLKPRVGYPNFQENFLSPKKLKKMVKNKVIIKTPILWNWLLDFKNYSI